MILLSHILDTNTPTYGNRDRLIIEEPSRIKDGSSANSSKWVFSTNHMGTHIDMPRHFFENGRTLTDVPVDFWFSDKIQLIDVPCSSAKLINNDDLKDEIDHEATVLLIRTGYEKFRKTDKYWNDNPGLAASFGLWLRKNKPNIKIVGFDFISLTSWKFREEGKRSHRAFLSPGSPGSPICIIEDMSLFNLNGKADWITVSPIFVENGNGGPVTVFCFLDSTTNKSLT